MTIDERWAHEDRVRVCDCAIYLAIRRGMPHWHTEGTGENVPSRRKYVFGEHCHADGAKADFCRGEDEDDLQNLQWTALYRKLVKYVRWIESAQGAGSEVTMGNAMESLVALCYHAATDGEYLQGHMDWTRGGSHPSSQPYFVLAW